MRKELKFRTDIDLWPEDPAFSDVVYQAPRIRSTVFSLDFSAKMICSPRKTGKTTHLNLMCANHLRASRFAPESKFFIRIPRRKGGFSEQNFRDLLLYTLKASGASSFEEAIRTSEAVKSFRSRKVLALIDVENLSGNALIWLLDGIKAFENKEKAAKRLNLQVLVDGSFSLDTLTWGPNSKYPLPQIIPPEFSQASQKRFIGARMRELNFQFGPSAYETLWSVTRGDKYLTQALCKRLIDRHQDTRGPVRLEEDEVAEQAEAYTREDPIKDDLKPDMLRALFRISEDSKHKEAHLKHVMENIDTRWNVMSVDERGHAYRGGLVRRTESGVKLRAPLLHQVSNETIRRARQARTLLRSHFALSGVSDLFQEKALHVTRDIMEHCYNQSLRILHVGFGKKVSDTCIRIDAAALYQGQYEGTWEIETNDSIRIGGGVWGLMWAWQDSSGVRKSETCILPATTKRRN